MAIKEIVTENGIPVHRETDSDMVKCGNDTLTEKLNDINDKLNNIGSNNIVTASSWEEACQKRLEAICYKWKAVSADNNNYIPCQTSEFSGGKFPTTTYVVGPPYSSTRQIDKYVGYNVSIRNWLSCIDNKYTKLYTETIDGSAPRSAHGVVYNATDCNAFMGTQCTAFVGYILGMPIYFLSHQYLYGEKMGYFIRKGQVRADKIKKWDVIMYFNGHALLITDVVYNGDTIVGIDVMESAGLVKKNGQLASNTNIATYTVTEFNNRFAAHNYVLYSVSHTKELSLDYEDVSNITFNQYFTTFEGDNASFKTTDIIKMAVKSVGSFTNFTVERNDSAPKLTTIYDSTVKWTSVHSISNIQSMSEHYITLPKLNAGLYRAYMSNGSNKSDYVYFEVIDTTVSASIVNGKCRVVFSSNKTVNGTTFLQARPMYIDFTDSFTKNGELVTQGNSIVRQLITPEEWLNGYADIDANVLKNWQSREGYSNNSNYNIENGFVKVLFKGEYGCLASDYVKSGY